MGLHTIRGRLLTLKGVKPKGKVQWNFQALWLYGLVELLTGDSFFYEFCHLDTVCFEKFLELFAQANPEDIHIIQLDNGGCHQALNLNLRRERNSAVSTVSLSRSQSDREVVGRNQKISQVGVVY